MPQINQTSGPYQNPIGHFDDVADARLGVGAIWESLRGYHSAGEAQNEGSSNTHEAEICGLHMNLSQTHALPPSTNAGPWSVLPQFIQPDHLTTESDQLGVVQERSHSLLIDRPTKFAASILIGVVSLLESGKIPFHKAGTHRRVKFVDLEAYSKAFEGQRRAALEELAKQAQDLDMGY